MARTPRATRSRTSLAAAVAVAAHRPTLLDKAAAVIPERTIEGFNHGREAGNAFVEGGVPYAAGASLAVPVRASSTSLLRRSSTCIACCSARNNTPVGGLV